MDNLLSGSVHGRGREEGMKRNKESEVRGNGVRGERVCMCVRERGE